MTRHGFEVWDTLVHVPLMIISPGAKPRHIDTLRSCIDLAPTILELFGLPVEPSFEGHSLVAEVYGGTPEVRDVVVDLPMTSDSSRRRAILHDTSKMICFDNDSTCRLYDLSTDPGERNALPRSDTFVDMKTRYDAASAMIKEVVPYACGADCLNTAYRKKQEVAP
jgi:arylsulfatase A-like enzyme